MILAQDSRIIIMDEPVTYLDLEGKRTFFSMVNKLKKSGKTIILVLHDLSDAIRISDNLVIMNDRKIAISDTPANCLKTHIIEDVFHTTYIYCHSYQCTISAPASYSYYLADCGLYYCLCLYTRVHHQVSS